MEYEIEICRSKRKSIGLVVKRAGVLTVRAPYRVSQKEIRSVIAKYQTWIEKQMEKMSRIEEQKESLVPFSKEEVEQMAAEALAVLPPKVRQYAAVLGVTYGRITIRNQKTRWGSCSSKGNLNFNCLLTQVPEPVLDYVIVHELCHRKEMNHSESFWRMVESVLPDYKERRKWLKQNGNALIERLNIS